MSLLTAGYDKPYALGLAAALTAEGVHVDFIGGYDQDVPELRNNERLRFLNLRPDSLMKASPPAKALRVLNYYAKLLRYAAAPRPRVFHILWHYKFELLNRTLLLLYYKLLGKRLVFTAHNVNAGKRDGNDSWLNRATLRIQYSLVDHIFVHTEQMKRELGAEFAVPDSNITVIPFGINNTVPNTGLTSSEAREKLGLNGNHRVILFFGNILRYKGLEYLVAAFEQIVWGRRTEDGRQRTEDGGRKTEDGGRKTEDGRRRTEDGAGSYRLIIVGKPKDGETYWDEIQQQIASSGLRDKIVEKIEYVPDEATELYFKAADVLVLPYRHIFQSGVLFLGYSFGLPVIAADVGSFKEEIIEGKTGFMFRPADSGDLARVIENYFESALFRELPNRRGAIRDYANQRYSWTKVGQATARVYGELVGS